LYPLIVLSACPKPALSGRDGTTMAAVFLLVVWRDVPLVLILWQFYIQDILCRFCTDESHGSTNSRTLLFSESWEFGDEGTVFMGIGDSIPSEGWITFS
jgi:hypothetical protein